MQLAKQFPEIEFHGIDHDKVEERNLGTQAYFLEHVGLHKVDAMRVVLARYLRKPNYKPFRVFIDRPEKIGIHDLTIDAFDNPESRELFRDVKGEVLHVGFSPDYSSECLWNKRYFEEGVPGSVDPTKNDVCQMVDANSFIQFSVSLAAMVVGDWIRSGAKREFLITGKNKVRWL